MSCVMTPVNRPTLQRHRAPVLENAVISHVRRVAAYVRQLHDHAPHAALNDLLGQLVDMIRPVYEPHIAHEILSGFSADFFEMLRHDLALCEYALEKSWAKKIIAGHTLYRDYPYIDSYDALVSAEIECMQHILSDMACHSVFIGSGPMPITAFEIKNRIPDIKLTCIERETEAFILGKNVGLASGIQAQHVLNDAARVDYADADIIFIASMVDNKRCVLEKIRETARVGTVVAVRSVEGLRAFLYAPLETHDIPQSYAFIKKTNYKPDHINTTYFYRIE